jgi:hypothetical protein
MKSGPGFEVRNRGRVVSVPSKALDRAAAKLSLARLIWLDREAEAGLQDYLKRVGQTMAQRHGKPYSAPGAGGGGLQSRSGTGVEALQNGLTRRKNGAVEGVIAVPFYMSLQEFGGTIRASGRHLAVPLPAALNPDGTAKKMGPRSWHNATVIQSKRGNLLIVLRQGRKLVPLYVLKKAVRIPPRLGLAKEMKRQAPALQKDIVQRIRKLISGANRVNIPATS